MEFTAVKAVDGIQSKSAQETEAELLKKHEEEQQAREAASAQEGAGQEGAAKTETELKEEDVLSFIGKRFGKQISSFDELMAERSNEELPDDVSAFLKYKKETGRGIKDFMALNEDFDVMDQNTLLSKHLSATQPELDDDDISSIIKDYEGDGLSDSESTVRQKKIAKKKAVAEAKKYFDSLKEKYKTPLESGGTMVSQKEKEDFERFKDQLNQSKSIEEENRKKSNYFMQKTDEIFGSGFKGFEFAVGEKKMLYAPGSAEELKVAQSSPLNFIGKFLDKDGLMQDANGYHRALAIAMNPEKFAKHFYEQGLADATEGTMKEIKNISMSEQKNPELIKKGGMQVKALNPDSGKSLKIQSRKKLK